MAKKKNTETKPDIIDSNLFGWLYTVSEFICHDDRNMIVYPGKINEYFDKIEAETAKQLEKIFKQMDVPVKDRKKELHIAPGNDAGYYRSDIDARVEWYPNGLFEITAGFHTLKMLGHGYNINIPEPKKTETSVETETFNSLDRRCIKAIYDIVSDKSIESPKLYSWSQTLLYKYAHDIFTHTKPEYGLRKLVSLRAQALKFKESIDHIDDHFERYDAFMVYLSDHVFGSMDDSCKRANEQAEYFIQQMNYILEHLYVLDVGVIDDLNLEDYNNIDDYMWYAMRKIKDWSMDELTINAIINDKDKLETILQRYRNHTWYTDGNQHDMTYETWHDMCGLFPEMFAIKTVRGYDRLITPVEKFIKDFYNLEDSYKMLFLELTAQPNEKPCCNYTAYYHSFKNTSVIKYVAAETEYQLNPEDCLWHIYVPSKDFKEQIREIIKNDNTEIDVRDCLIDTANMTQAEYQFADDTLRHIDNNPDTLNSYIENERHKAYHDLLQAAMKASINGSTLTIDETKQVMQPHLESIRGNAVWPTDEKYEQVKAELKTNIDLLLTRLDKLETGLLASDSSDFIQWCIKEKFIETDKGNARLKELEEITETKEVPA